jgi:hypothetical protein
VILVPNGSTVLTNAITLPNPQVGDVHRIAQTQVLTNTVTGLPLAGKLAHWTPTESFVYKLICRKADKDIYVTFYNANLGLKIRWIDHLGTDRSGFIISDLSTIRAFRKMYEVGIEILVDTES